MPTRCMMTTTTKCLHGAWWPLLLNAYTVANKFHSRQISALFTILILSNRKICVRSWRDLDDYLYQYRRRAAEQNEVAQQNNVAIKKQAATMEQWSFSLSIFALTEWLPMDRIMSHYGQHSYSYYKYIFNNIPRLFKSSYQFHSPTTKA